MNQTTEISKNRRTLQGVVVSNKGDKTIVVKVGRTEQHPLYGKIVRRSKKFHAHDEQNQCNEGDTVIIEESRPISKMKSWKLVALVEKSVNK